MNKRPPLIRSDESLQLIEDVETRLPKKVIIIIIGVVICVAIILIIVKSVNKNNMHGVAEGDGGGGRLDALGIRMDSIGNTGRKFSPSEILYKQQRMGCNVSTSVLSKEVGQNGSVDGYLTNVSKEQCIAKCNDAFRDVSALGCNYVTYFSRQATVDGHTIAPRTCLLSSTCDIDDPISGTLVYAAVRK